MSSHRIRSRQSQKSHFGSFTENPVVIWDTRNSPYFLRRKRRWFDPFQQLHDERVFLFRTCCLSRKPWLCRAASGRAQWQVSLSETSQRGDGNIGLFDGTIGKHHWPSRVRFQRNLCCLVSRCAVRSGFHLRPNSISCGICKMVHISWPEELQLNWYLSF